MRSEISTQNFYRFTLPQNLNTRISLLLLSLCFFGGAWGQLFIQNFSSSSTVSSYVNLSSPNNSQFNGIGTSGSGTVLSINNGKLRFSRTGNAGSFTRSTDISSTSSSSLIFKFDIEISGNSTSQTTAAVFQLGSGFSVSNTTEANSLSHSRLGLNISSTAGSFSFRDISAASNSISLSGGQTIMWVINNSGGLLTYKGPDGSFQTVGNDKWDLWAGSTSIFNESASQTVSQSLDDFKFLFTAGNANIEFDNIVIDPIPTVPSAPTVSSVTSTTFTVDWSAVAGSTGYRIDIDDNIDFSSPLNNYNDFFVSGTSENISGLSPYTTYYIRLRSENYAGTSGNSSSVSQVTSCITGNWIGGTSGDWNSSSNWCGGLPGTNASVTIPSGITVTLNNGGLTTLTDLTINGTLIVNSTEQLTVLGSLTNSGTLTLENGATLVQTGSNANAGSGGTYNVKQVITGSSSGSAPNGRGWYMGSPVSGATSNLFAPTNSTNLIYHWNANQTTPNWAQHVAGSASTLEIGKGYAVRVGETSSTITFSSSTLNNAPTPIAIPCYKQASTNYQGFNLVSNPFASYLDWNDAWTGTNASNFDNTIYYRVADGSNVMVFDTYNAETGLSTNTSGSFATRYIPPMQAFWVKVASGVSASSNTVNLSLTNSMRDHYTSVTNGWSAGLKSTAQDFPMFLRLNIEQGTFKDQTLVYLNTQASSQFDGFDSEKMFLTGYPQVYTKIGSRKLVFNGLNSNKKITVIPVIVDIPTSGLFTFKAEEFNVEAGLILLEDKQEGITQDLTVNDAYTFYANAGTISNRFFIRLHQLDPSISSQGPSNNWVESENEINEGGSVVVATNGRGKVTIQQDIDSIASDESDVTIRDAAGREVLSGKLTGLESVFQLDVPSGVYFVAVQLNGQVEVKKIFVQQ